MSMRRAQIEGVRVAAPWRGQGLGRAMLGWAIEGPPGRLRPCPADLGQAPRRRHPVL
ncbi:hypothetical protein [Trebonia sp.]|uniref:hypothetical protein n=1 Tax=Trebonia sp. TaxID=2767075 RepID=UPI003BAEB397